MASVDTLCDRSATGIRFRTEYGREYKTLSRLLELPDEHDSKTTDVTAYRGDLVDLLASSDVAAELKAASASYPSWDLTDRQLCDLELLANGAFSDRKSVV